jgi:Peptidase MA superfamily
VLLGGPQAVTVGRVTAVAWPGQAGLAAALAAEAARATPFPGIGPLPDRPIRLIVADTRARYDSLTEARLPTWSEGAAFPDLDTIVLLCEAPSDCLHGTLRHELAHLALTWRVGHPLPLWFQEGYAALAAGQWSDLDALQLNWQVARGALPNLDELDQTLRGDRVDAGTAYALAMTAVALLQRWGGSGGLERLIDNLARGGSFDAALRATYHVTEGDFERRWQRDVGRRYGWVAWASSVGLFWAVIAVLLVWLVRVRRRRDRVRRAALDEGWTVSGEDDQLLDGPDVGG